jgi:hypothetical protein
VADQPFAGFGGAAQVDFADEVVQRFDVEDDVFLGGLGGAAGGVGGESEVLQSLGDRYQFAWWAVDEPCGCVLSLSARSQCSNCNIFVSRGLSALVAAWRLLARKTQEKRHFLTFGTRPGRQAHPCENVR